LVDPLILAARSAQKHAYCPYSKYRVGAAIESLDGEVFTGCNVESASYGLTVCAERSAVFAAVAAGKRHFKRIVVATDSTPPAPPCGACRQVLLEFGPEIEVESVGPTESRRWQIRDLLPDAFTKDLLS
jgi:cytidine deaminase